RSVEEGDIYRVLSDSLILNLNSYRGLQIIDFGDPSQPEMIGSLALLGTPVELYVLGDRAYVLLNRWHGFYGVPYQMELTERYGASAVVVDLSDPSAPELIDQAEIPGQIATSRMVHGDESAALYVATQAGGRWTYGFGSEATDAHAEVISFDISDGTLEQRGQVEIQGMVSDIQATPSAILVAVRALNESLVEPREQARVTLVDIDDPTGAILEGGHVWIDGYVMSQFNLDLHEGVLRVISSSTRWGSDASNTLQTFDASDIYDLRPIDSLDFGAGQRLYATLFLGNKAFAVTFLRIDPFHAFEISAEGQVHEAMEYEVTGWNDFFRDVFGQTRLIGVGSDQVGSRTVAAVSLYEIEDLTNPHPLIARTRIDESGGWSEARWDHRAFSVLENTVDVLSPAGDVETGLVLLPFSARWSGSERRSGVQIFTFSRDSLTARGAMRQKASVRRSFLADEALTANLSRNGLSLVDVSSVDDPEELGRMNLSPNYRNFFDLGEYGARIETSYWDLGGRRLDVIALAEDPDGAEALAGIDLPLYASLYQVGDQVVSVDRGTQGVREIQVYDLSNPLAPRRASSLTDYYERYRYWHDPTVIDNALAFVQDLFRSEVVNERRICRRYPLDTNACRSQTTVDVNGEPLIKNILVPDCTYHRVVFDCTEDLVCSDQFQECYVDLESNTACENVDADDVPTREKCFNRSGERVWLERELKILDLRDPDSAQITVTAPFPTDAEGIALIPDASNLWLSYRVPVEAAAAERSGEVARPLAKFYIQRTDASNPQAPVFGPPINVPGTLLAVEGSVLYTHDYRWQDEVVENTIVRLELIEGRAYEQAAYSLGDAQVGRVRLDGAGHILIGHRAPFEFRAHDLLLESAVIGLENQTGSIGDSRSFRVPGPEFLTVLAANEFLEELSTTEIGSSYSLREALPGRALYSARGGALILNLEDPREPYFQAFLPTQDWPNRFTVIDRDLYVPAGSYGIFKFDLDEFNLLEP
ncbi:MAG: beta-propeller domain-containing protein, partial [Deltaproteobacteria bacterium]|nr:beta-propeller domain-containing protein [Deltaproteobacteria bacterium]